MPVWCMVGWLVGGKFVELLYAGGGFHLYGASTPKFNVCVTREEFECNRKVLSGLA
jgi:hypothetical protein